MAGPLDNGTLTQVLIWLSALVFGAGGMFAQVVGARDAVDHLKTEVSYHTSQPGHPVSMERLDTLMVEQRALRADVTDQGKSLAAICQATGAICE